MLARKDYFYILILICISDILSKKFKFFSKSKSLVIYLERLNR